MSSKSRAVSAKGAADFKPSITRAIPLNAVITCADNTGARTLRVIQVMKYRTRLRRLPAASVGDHVLVVVQKGKVLVLTLLEIEYVLVTITSEIVGSPS